MFGRVTLLATPQMRDDSGYSHLTLRLSECVGKYWNVLICRYCHTSHRHPRDLIAQHGDMLIADFGRLLVCRTCGRAAPVIQLAAMNESEIDRTHPTRQRRAE